MGQRSGTENISGIIGLTKALELVQDNRLAENKRLFRKRTATVQSWKAGPGVSGKNHPAALPAHGAMGAVDESLSGVALYALG